MKLTGFEQNAETVLDVTDDFIANIKEMNFNLDIKIKRLSLKYWGIFFRGKQTIFIHCSPMLVISELNKLLTKEIKFVGSFDIEKVDKKAEEIKCKIKYY
jgi:hypothetical protein